MNSTLTLSTKTAAIVSTPTLGDFSTVKTNCRKPLTLAQIKRTIVCKWDMFAVIGLMVSCTAYGIFAIAHVA